MLKLNNIEVAYLNVIRVLHGVSLKVDDGIIVALLGANGAGKSTTLKAISGLLKIEEGLVTDGNIEWDGERIDKKNAEEIGKMGIIQALEGRHVFGHLTTEENLAVGRLIVRIKTVSNKILRWSTIISRVLKSSAIIPPVTFPAANSRCWSSGGQ